MGAPLSLFSHFCEKTTHGKHGRESLHGLMLQMINGEQGYRVRYGYFLIGLRGQGL